MFKKLTIITNPIAGSGRAMKFLETLKTDLAHHQIENELKLTAQAGDALQIAREYSEDHPILCLGGDGTVNEIINGLLSNNHFTVVNRPVLGIIPFGSGNVIAKELHLKRNIRHFIHLYQNNFTRYLDVGCIHLPAPLDIGTQAGLLEANKSARGGSAVGTEKQKKDSNQKRYFISMAGIGFDAEVTRQYQLDRNGAKLQAHLFSYFPIAIKTIARYQMPHITIQIDDKIVSSDATFVQVANVRSYGGPFVLVNNAVSDDGLLDICWFSGKSSLNLILYYTFAFLGNGSLIASGKLKSKKIILSSKQTVPLQVDGDFCGYLPVEIGIIPKSIQVYTSI